MSARSEIDDLVERLLRFQREYAEGRPSVSDAEYDRLFDRLRELEAAHPDLRRPDSPTQRVGSDLSQQFPEVAHTIPVLSLDKCYTIEELESWIAKLEEGREESLSFVLEEKIDGAGIVLYYEGGVLARALTRGNGAVGNDVTGNVRTIRSVPLRLPQPVNAAFRGEVFLPRDRFEEFNSGLETPYSSPRNLAAGTLRRIKSSEVAAFPLEVFLYEGYFEGGAETHFAILERMKRLGLSLNPRIGFFSNHHDVAALRVEHPSWRIGRLEDLAAFVREEVEARDTLRYEIDGLVLKVNEIAIREEVGSTGHHPRWAIAFKFEAPVGRTTVQRIEIQVGRTGRITPVARVAPVRLAGSTISNVTLHNQAYIDLLELAEGDVVEVSRRGDVIPAVERVLEKNESGATTWRMPDRCPACAAKLVEVGAHHFCPNAECPDQIRGRLRFFVGRGQMDIENLGPETLETLYQRGLVRDVADIYTFDPAALEGVEGFGEKKIALIREGIEKSRGQPYERVLVSLGVPDLGQKAVELLLGAGIRDIDTLLDIAHRGDVERLTSIHGIGEKTAQLLVDELRRPAVRRRIEALRAAGLRFSAPQAPAAARAAGPLAGQTWCVTGSFERFKPREKAMEEVVRLGGRVSSSVTSKTTHLLAGESPGSKLARARELGVTIVSEEEFLRLIEGR